MGQSKRNDIKLVPAAERRSETAHKYYEVLLLLPANIRSLGLALVLYTTWVGVHDGKSDYWGALIEHAEHTQIHRRATNTHKHTNTLYAIHVSYKGKAALLCFYVHTYTVRTCLCVL